MGLTRYKAKRNFQDTPEPRGRLGKKETHRFVIQEHHASHLHYDFRLEMDGVLRSWAVPKGPSMDPTIRRLAMMVEDHPIEYIDFSGTINEGNYGAGEVRVWDTGTYTTTEPEGKPVQGILDGKIVFILKGKKLQGEFHMVHTDENRWLLMKGKDKYAEKGWELERLLDYGNRNADEKEDELKKETKKRARKKLPKVGTWKSNREAEKLEKPAAKKPAAKKPAAKKPAAKKPAAKRPAAKK